MGFPQDEHVGVNDKQHQDAGHSDPEHQVFLVNQRENVGADRSKVLAVPAQQWQKGDDDGDGPHHAEGSDRFGLCDDAFVRHRPVDGDVTVNCSEKQTPHRGGEGGDDPRQLEEEDVWAVLSVEDVKVQEAVDENDASDQISHSQAAYEVVGRARSKRLRVQDHTEHHQVFQHGERSKGERQDGDRQLLAGREDHETLQIVCKVLRTLMSSPNLHGRDVSDIGHVHGKDGRDCGIKDLFAFGENFWKGAAEGGMFPKAEAVLDQAGVGRGVVVAGIVGAQIAYTCCEGTHRGLGYPGYSHLHSSPGRRDAQWHHLAIRHLQQQTMIQHLHFC